MDTDPIGPQAVAGAPTETRPAETRPAETRPAEAGPALDLDAVTAELAAVEAALERLDDGSYGRCLACDEAIADADLAVAPTQTTCAAHLPV